MDHQHSYASVSDLVDRACRSWEAKLRAAPVEQALAPPPRAFTIALAREAGTQGTAIAQEVGRLLHWPAYDHELLELIAKDMGLRANLLESVDERGQSWLVETAEALLSAPRVGDWGPLVSESGYVHHLVQVVLALGAHGECIIVGRGSPFILPAATTLRVRLVAGVRERVTVQQQRLGISEKEAAKQVRSIDRERTGFVQGHFFKDPLDPQNYDMILNVSRWGVNQSAELIVDALRRLQAHAIQGKAI